LGQESVFVCSTIVFRKVKETKTKPKNTIRSFRNRHAARKNKPGESSAERRHRELELFVLNSEAGAVWSRVASVVIERRLVLLIRLRVQCDQVFQIDAQLPLGTQADGLDARLFGADRHLDLQRQIQTSFDL